VYAVYLATLPTEEEVAVEMAEREETSSCED